MTPSRQRFNPIDFYRKPAPRKSLSVPASKIRRTPVTTAQLSPVGHLFDKAAPVIADYITRKEEEKKAAAARAEMKDILLTYYGEKVIDPPPALTDIDKEPIKVPGGIEAVNRMDPSVSREAQEMRIALIHDAHRQRQAREAAELAHQRAIKLRRVSSGTGGNARFSNTPIWGKDEEGKSVVMQSSSTGGPLRIAGLPPGVVTAERGQVSYQNLGDKIAIFDANGQFIGYRAKGIDPVQTPEHAAKVSAAKAGGAGTANRRLKEYNLARNATNNIKDIDMLTSRLLSTDDSVVGFLVNLRVFRDQALAKGFGSQEALARVTDTEMVDTLTGREVFPLIKALGIGARGLDTPAERKFLRQVLTGDKTLTKDTLLEMAAIRREVQVRNIERWNKDFEEGSLNDFLRTNNIPNRAFAMPPPAPVRTPINISMPISQMNVMQLNEKAKSATADERRKIGLQLDALGYK